ncbi:MAG TPA: hypothetical protein DEV93_22860 [Chloroflexi bacterium]|nr:hypothetical protein [Chloroflexota bacterium]
MEVVIGDRTIPYLLKGSRPGTIVFLPALGTRASMWSKQIDRFSDRYTVVAPELGGHDSTSSGASFEDLVRDLESVLGATGATWAHVVGISLGGMIAQEFALRCPERVLSLTLVNTTSRYSEETREAFRRRAKTVEQEGMSTIAESVLQRWFTPAFLQSHSEELSTVRSMLLKADPHAYASMARVVADVDTYERLPQIEVPTLVVRADEDASMPSEASGQLAARIPNAELARVPRLAHLFPVEGPEAFDALFSPFLDRATKLGVLDWEREEPAHAW